MSRLSIQVRKLILLILPLILCGCGTYQSITVDNIGPRLEEDNGIPQEKIITTHYCAHQIIEKGQTNYRTGDCVIALYDDEIYFYAADPIAGMSSRTLQLSLKDIMGVSSTSDNKSEKVLQGQLLTNDKFISFHVINSISDPYGKQETTRILDHIKSKGVPVFKSPGYIKPDFGGFHSCISGICF